MVLKKNLNFVIKIDKNHIQIISVNSSRLILLQRQIKSQRIHFRRKKNSKKKHKKIKQERKPKNKTTQKESL